MIREFREKLGLSQEFMAIYLGLNRSLLAMIEIGQRELPNATLLKLAELATFLEQTKTTDKTIEKIEAKQELQLQDFLAKQIKELEFQKLKTERELDAIQKKYNQNIVLQQWALHLQEMKSSLRSVLMNQGKQGIEKNSWVAQTKLILKLEAIESQLEYCQTLKEK